MSKTLPRILTHAGLVVLLILQMLPIVTILFNAVRTNDDVRRALLALPEGFAFENFVNAWVKGNFLVAFFNTAVIGAGTVITVLVVNVLAAYGLTKLKIIGKSFFITYFVIGIAVPSFAIIVPIFFGMSYIGLVNTKIGMVIIYSATSLPFSLLLMRSYFMGIPRELEEAALIDGCSELGALVRITLPLARPILVTVVLIVFVGVYNEFLFANVMLQGQDSRTVALSFYNFVGRFSQDLATIFAAAFIALGPILALYLMLQRRFVDGMTAGGLKG